MSYLQSQMLYDDGYYNWKAADEGDNPKIIGGIDRKQLNRTEGFEVLPFINKIAKDYWTNEPANLKTFEKIEKMIRHHVPITIKNQDEIAKWIVDNWKKS